MKKILIVIILILSYCLVENNTAEPKWTIETLKEYEDLKIEQLNQKIEIQFKMASDALEKADAKMGLRLEGINEWRLQNRDERSQYASKDEVNGLTKLVYTGLGIVFALQFIITIYFRKSINSKPNS